MGVGRPCEHSTNTGDWDPPSSFPPRQANPQLPHAKGGVRQADAVEAAHAKLSTSSPDDARRVIRQILGKKVAEGLTVGVKHDGHTIFIGILPPVESEALQAIAERAIQAARRIETVQDDTRDTAAVEENEQDNRPAEAVSASARVEAPQTILIDGVEVDSRDLDSYLIHHPPRP